MSETLLRHVTNPVSVASNIYPEMNLEGVMAVILGVFFLLLPSGCFCEEINNNRLNWNMFTSLHKRYSISIMIKDIKVDLNRWDSGAKVITQ